MLGFIGWLTGELFLANQVAQLFMEKVLLQIAHLLLESVPTVVFVFIAFLVLDKILFRPLTKVLDERDKMTRGAIERASKNTEQAETQTENYDKALQQVQQEIYHLREASRQHALAQREKTLKQARTEAERMMENERGQIARDAEMIKGKLGTETQALAKKISETVAEVTF